MNIFRSIALVAALAVLPAAAFAKTATVQGDPSVAVDVPAGFESSNTSRGVQINTPDDEVMVWFETYKPADQDALVEEHGSYWKDQGVTLGTPDRSTDESDGHKIIVSLFKDATWKGKPTVVRYLIIDAGLPSKEMILMSLWASPEGMNAHGDDVGAMIKSLDFK